MTSTEIHSARELLKSYYYSDLSYIANFHRFRREEFDSQDYLKPIPGSFYNFLVEYRIVRNIEKGSAGELVRITQTWCSMSSPDDVDEFAQTLKQHSFSRNATLSSLASKVLFLNNPWKILPMDALGRKALAVRKNIYSIYAPKIAEFAEDNSSVILEQINELRPYCEHIEAEFKDVLSEIELIRKNRFIDKLLWIKGSR